MTKRLSLLLVLVLMMLSMVSYVGAEELTEEFDLTPYGEGLQELGILKGTDKGLELDSELTRIQGMIIYFRMLGYGGTNLDELDIDTKHPFTDVPNWANEEVGVLYNLGLVKGISKTKLGSNDKMTIEQFTTLMLRALGYNDSEGDFVWNKSVEKFLGEMLELEKHKPGLFDFLNNKDKFTRGDMSFIAFQTLHFNLKGSDVLLMDKLGIEGISKTYESYIQISDEDEGKIPEEFRRDFYFIIEHDYGEEYNTEDLTIFDVNYIDEDGDKFKLEFKLRIVYDDNGELKDVVKDVIFRVIDIEDGYISGYGIDESSEE